MKDTYCANCEHYAERNFGDDCLASPMSVWTPGGPRINYYRPKDVNPRYRCHLYRSETHPVEFGLFNRLLRWWKGIS